MMKKAISSIMVIAGVMLIVAIPLNVRAASYVKLIAGNYSVANLKEQYLDFSNSDAVYKWHNYNFTIKTLTGNCDASGYCGGVETWINPQKKTLGLFFSMGAGQKKYSTPTKKYYGTYYVGNVGTGSFRYVVYNYGATLNAGTINVNIQDTEK